MFERFTDRSRRVMVLAQEESRMLCHSNIGTEHLLVGLIHERDGIAAKALDSVGVTLESARAQVEVVSGNGAASELSGHIPFTPLSKKTLELALREALRLEHDYIGTEHILLALLKQDEGPAVQVLTNLGINFEELRENIMHLLSGKQPMSRSGVMTINFSDLGLATELTNVSRLQFELGDDDPKFKGALADLLETAASRVRESIVAPEQ